MFARVKALGTVSCSSSMNCRSAGSPFSLARLVTLDQRVKAVRDDEVVEWAEHELEIVIAHGLAPSDQHLFGGGAASILEAPRDALAKSSRGDLVQYLACSSRGSMWKNGNMLECQS